MIENEPPPAYIVTALEEYDVDSGDVVIIYMGDSLHEACSAVENCSSYRRAAFYKSI